MNENISENRERASREEILTALKKYAERLDVSHLKRVQEGEVTATEAEKCAAKAILWCVESVSRHGGLDILSAIQRIYAYSLASEPVGEVYDIANTPNPAHPTFPSKTEDVYGCRAILYAMELVGATL